METLKQLFEASEKHPYYCIDSNYYSNECSFEYKSFNEFLNEWNDADLDYNLLFRWDLKKYDNDVYYLQLFYALQRKGIFLINTVFDIKEDDIVNIVEYLNKYKQYNNKLWNI